MFNAWNEAQAARLPLLMVADAPPPAWRVALPDLRSRLSATPVVTLGDPDDDLIGALIEAQLARRGVSVSPEVIAYIVPRAPRSHARVIALADALDAASLARRQPVTVPLVRAVLGPPIDVVRVEG